MSDRASSGKSDCARPSGISPVQGVACGEGAPSVKGLIDLGSQKIGTLMSLSAAGIILLFLVGFGILNRYEFGRFD
jgi:hypothetical protein